MKRQTKTGKQFSNYVSDRYLYPKYIKNSYNSLIKDNPILKWSKYLNRELSKKLYGWLINTKKVFNIVSYLENVSQNILPLFLHTTSLQFSCLVVSFRFIQWEIQIKESRMELGGGGQGRKVGISPWIPSWGILC